MSFIRRNNPAVSRGQQLLLEELPEDRGSSQQTEMILGRFPDPAATLLEGRLQRPWGHRLESVPTAN